MGKRGKRFLTAENAEDADIQRVFSLRKEFSTRSSRSGTKFFQLSLLRRNAAVLTDWLKKKKENPLRARRGKSAQEHKVKVKRVLSLWKKG